MNTLTSPAEPAQASARPLDIARVRGLFPSLATGTAFLDNAGGSQLPAVVIDAMARYMRESFVQTGAEYDESRRAAASIARAREVVHAFLNADQAMGQIILGPSTTALCNNLAWAYGESFAAEGGRDEVIVCTAGHEANVGCWFRLASRGMRVTPWHAERDDDGVWRPRLDTLRALLSSRTRVVAFPQVSNLCGEVWDARAVAELCRNAGARSVIDGVAYAAHQAPDVRRLGCDWYVYSTYKVFGPHAAAMFGGREALAELTGPNHAFIPRESVPHKWEPGGANHESCAGIAALWEYVCALTGDDASAPPNRGGFERAFASIAPAELALQRRFLEWASARRDLTIVGPRTHDASRVATISLVSSRTTSRALALELNRQGLGVKHGSFYSVRLCETMGLDPADGVLRVSFAHYNSLDEADRLCRALDRL